MIRIGKIVATHGLQGSVILKHIAGDSTWLKNEDVLFIELKKESYIPFFVTENKAANDEEYIITLEDTLTSEAAKKLVGKHVYVQADVLKGHVEDTPLLWIGFNMVDKNKGSLGTVDDVMQTGAQWLAKVNYEGSEVLIPLVSDFIIEVNTRNKYIRVDLPEGLIEIYTK
jgi:16S rRNA processing protein RimM